MLSDYRPPGAPSRVGRGPLMGDRPASTLDAMSIGRLPSDPFSTDIGPVPPAEPAPAPAPAPSPTPATPARPDAAAAHEAWHRHASGGADVRVHALRAAAAARAPAAPAPINGWPSARAPNGRVLPFDLSKILEDDLLTRTHRVALHALGDGPDDFHPEREPLILVHGIRGDPGPEFQALVDRLRGSPRHQLYVLAYDDFHRRTELNGVDFARELSTLRERHLGPDRDVTIVGHSLGGIVTRRALNELAAGPDRGLERFGDVRFVAVDTPWHGYSGPSDRGVEGFFMSFARPFMPDGLEDMRAASNLFRGDPDGRTVPERAGLYGVELPRNVTVDLLFAEQGDQVQDFTEADLTALAPQLVRHYRDAVPVEGDRRLLNFWRALGSSRTHAAFEDEMRAAARDGRLDEDCVRAALLRHYPRFAGDHSGVLDAAPAGGAGRASLVDYLTERLR